MELERLNHLKTEVLGVAAHDPRNLSAVPSCVPSFARRRRERPDWAAQSAPSREDVLDHPPLRNGERVVPSDASSPASFEFWSQNRSG